MWGKARGLLMAGLVGLGTASCGIVEKELGNRGGFVDAEMDHWFFRADHKLTRAIRAYMLQASLVRMATVSPRTASEKNLVVARIINANDRLSEVVRCALRDTTCIHFDSVMVDYENVLYELALSVLDIEGRRTLLSRAAGLLAGPAAVLPILDLLVDMASEALRVGRPLGAVYRDGIELQLKVAFSTKFYRDEGRTELDTEFEERKQQMRTLYMQRPSDVRAWKDALLSLYSLGYEPVPGRAHFHMIYAFIWHYCGQLGVSETDGIACRQSPTVFNFDIGKVYERGQWSLDDAVSEELVISPRRRAAGQRRAVAERSAVVVQPRSNEPTVIVRGSGAGASAEAGRSPSSGGDRPRSCRVGVGFLRVTTSGGPQNVRAPVPVSIQFSDAAPEGYAISLSLADAPPSGPWLVCTSSGSRCASVRLNRLEGAALPETRAVATLPVQGALGVASSSQVQLLGPLQDASAPFGPLTCL
jgi:hypothetical protein